jgi:serine/threonine protein kinase
MRLFTHILDGMSHAHAKSVVHRDLKPANILLSDADSPVIADWGIAHIEGGARLTLTDEAVGARNYIPPEAEVGRVDDVAASFDVYSLGKILYWLLSGRELVREYVREPNYNLCQVLGESRYEAVNQLLDKCVTEQPSSRFKDAGELREAFDELSKTLEKYVNFPSTDSTQRCIYCGIGKYEAIAPYRNGEGQSERRPLDALIGIQGGVYHGTEPGGLRAMICDRCGNVQLFRVEFRSGNEKSTLPGRPWRSKAK